MTSTSLYLKLIHASSSLKHNYASSLPEPLAPYNTNTTTPMGPLGGETTPTLTEPPSISNTTSAAPYDHYGAMLFTVATVCVYGLSIVFFICGHTKKRVHNKDEERQISSYLKRLHLDEPSMDNRKFFVIKLKSQMLADSALGQRHNRRVSLKPRSLEQFVRRGEGREERTDEESDNSDNDGDDDQEEEVSHLANALFFNNRECTVQNVNEELESTPAVPFRGRRSACVGLGIAARPGGGSRSGGPREGLGSKRSSQRPGRVLPSSLTSIEEDDISMHSLTRLLSTQPNDSSHIQSPGFGDPDPEFPSRTLRSPGTSSRDTAEGPPCSEWTQENDGGSESDQAEDEQMQSDSCGPVMVTRF